MFCVSDCIADRVEAVIPQAAKRQHIGNEIDAAMIATRSDFVRIRFAIRPQCQYLPKGKAIGTEN